MFCGVPQGPMAPREPRGHQLPAVVDLALLNGRSTTLVMRPALGIPNNSEGEGGGGAQRSAIFFGFPSDDTPFRSGNRVSARGSFYSRFPRTRVPRGSTCTPTDEEAQNMVSDWENPH